MKAETRKYIQVFLAVALIAAAARLVIIFRERREPAQQARAKAAPPLDPTFYVVPKKLYPHDLKSARQLTQQPAWVKEGYKYYYYSYDRARHHADFAHDAGLLGPIEKLDIRDVVTDITPGARDQRQVLAVFEKGGKSYAVPIGVLKGGNYQIYSDEMFFIQDPHQLYNVWPKEVWQAIDQHQAKPGMDEVQVSFALGMGVPQPSEDSDLKTVKFPNGGKPLEITFRKGRAADIRPGS
ncbi:MAG: hypothetical protein ACM3PW_01995 [Chlamydiota bacterium]